MGSCEHRLLWQTLGPTRSFRSPAAPAPIMKLLLPLLSIVVAAGGPAALPASAPPRPNIIVIMADDMGYSDIGPFGGEIATPNLDRLARGGLRFSQFYTTPKCFPSRAALLTGLYPHQTGLGRRPEKLQHGLT